ncbi:MAG: hypothetical protein WBP59_16270 [Ilumatobacteraceae bacterium]
MIKHRIHSTLFAAALLATPLAVAACGDDNDNDTTADAASDNDDGDTSGDSGGGADIDAVSTCLTNAGFEVTREADQDPALVLPDEYKSSVGLIESVTLGSLGSVKGIGSVAFYESADVAEQANEDGAGMRTDDVMAGVVGTATWDFIVTAGDDPGVESMVTGCLSR